MVLVHAYVHDMHLYSFKVLLLYMWFGVRLDVPPFDVIVPVVVVAQNENCGAC